MAIYNEKINKLIPYTDQDYDSIMTSMIDSIPEITPEYNDLSETDFGMTILEEVGKVADVLSWKTDVTMNEALPGNATSRKAALIQSKWLCYKPKQNISAITNLKFVIINDGTNITIPKGVRVSNGAIGDDEIIFETMESILGTPPVGIAIGDTFEVFCRATHGESTEEYLGKSDGKPNQNFTIHKTPYIYKSLYLEILDVITNKINIYNEADYLFEMKNSDSKFIVNFDENGYGTIQLGDGINGSIPSTNCDILARYKIGGGTKGNISVGVINKIIDVFDERVSSVTNVSEGIGGEDEESVSFINDNASYYLSTRKRLVTINDYILFARNQVGVADAWYEKDMTYIDVYNLYLLPKNKNLSGVPELNKNDILVKINKMCLLGDDVVLKDPIWHNIVISIELTSSPLYDKASVENGVFNELKKLIDSKILGETLSISDIYNKAQSVDGVVKIKINKLCKKGNTTIGDIDCANKEVVRLELDEDIVITFASTV